MVVKAASPVENTEADERLNPLDPRRGPALTREAQGEEPAHAGSVGDLDPLRATVPYGGAVLKAPS